MHQDLIPSVEVCKILGINRSTLSRWVTAKKITPALKLTGRTQPMFFERADVESLRKPAAAA
jgi:predicted site-specific integrase-resolvase